MTSRSYLSIGDVLTLLREEFPDVTISKIRFLESQGLVNPERSPSGYRKFFEADVERLRWVLRQQREHFLPLKVIRDRLSEGDLDDVAGEVPEPLRRNGKVPQPAHAGAEAGAATTTRVAGAAPAPGSGTVSGSGSAAGSARTEEQMAKADDEAMARILADASRRAALIPPADGGNERAPLRVVTDPDATTPKGDGDGGEAGKAGGAGGAPVGPAARPSGTVPAAASTPAPLTPSEAPHTDPRRARAEASAPTPAATAAATAGPGPAASPAGPPNARPSEPGRMKAPAQPTGAAPKSGPSGGNRGGSAAGSGVSSTTSMVTGASLTADELCAASGLTEIELAGLQGFGLIESEMVAGILTFNEEALTVANLAAEFRKFGIEPRHLRLYRNAVDREIGLIEQVIIPLLRQRNPESRQRAVESADELGTLGQSMRASLLRSALRRHVGG